MHSFATLTAVACLLLATVGQEVYASRVPLDQQVNAALERHIVGNTVRVSSATDPTATIELHESLFRKTFSQLTPVIVDTVKAIVIPGETKEHFSFDAIHISEFNIGTLAMTFAAPSTITFSINDMSLAVPSTHFDVFTKILFVKASCGGQFWVSLAGTTIAITVPMEKNPTTGHIAVGKVASSVTFGKLDVGHHFHSFFCRVGQDIIQLFVGNIDSLIRKVVEEKIAPMLQTKVQAALTNICAKVPFTLATAPSATSHHIEFDINLLSVLPKTDKRPVPLMALTKRGHISSTFPARDVELKMSADSADGVGAHLAAAHILDANLTIPPSVANTTVLKTLIPKAYDACPACPFSVEFDVRKGPLVYFENDSAELSTQGTILGLNAVDAHGAIVPLIDVTLNYTGSLTNFSVSGTNMSTVKFLLSMKTIDLALYSSAIGPINFSVINDLLKFVLQNVVVPDFNKKFKGITIPPFKNVALEDLEISLSGGYFMGGLDIDFSKV